jgi:sortase A
MILLVLGLVLVGLFAAASLDRYMRSQAELRLFTKPSTQALASEGAVQMQSAGSEGSIASGIETVQARRPQPRGPIAVVEIPSVHLRAPVMEGVDFFTLNHAVGRIPGTARPGEEGNIGIAGHRDTFFRPLKDIKRGDTIRLRARSGTDFYKVSRIQIVSPKDISALRPQRYPSLTLVTCYPFYYAGNAPQRFVVTAFRTQRLPAGQTTTEPRPQPSTRSINLEEQ